MASGPCGGSSFDRLAFQVVHACRDMHAHQYCHFADPCAPSTRQACIESVGTSAQACNMQPLSHVSVEQ